MVVSVSTRFEANTGSLNFFLLFGTLSPAISTVSIGLDFNIWNHGQSFLIQVLSFGKGIFSERKVNSISISNGNS
jgi:hypothetical protein